MLLYRSQSRMVHIQPILKNKKLNPTRWFIIQAGKDINLPLGQFRFAGHSYLTLPRVEAEDSCLWLQCNLCTWTAMNSLQVPDTFFLCFPQKYHTKHWIIKSSKYLQFPNSRGLLWQISMAPSGQTR